MKTDTEPRKNRPGTIREIAKMCGVSIATVSRVINNPESVRPEKRQAVLQAIEKSAYVNDGLAKALAGGKSMTLGLVIPTITNSIYASSTQAIQRIAQQAGYSVILGVSDFDTVLEARIIRRLVERRVDGLILTGGEHDRSVFRMLKNQNIPFVLTWRLAKHAEIPCVSFDNYKAGRLAMKHLIDLGHRRIGLICGRCEVNDRARERRRAFEDSLIEIGATIDSELIFERDFEFIEGHAAMYRMLQAPDPPTAVFAASDILAIGAIAHCRESGISVPNDISVIGFDDLPIARFSSPGLTTVHVPANSMGRIAATRLLQLISGEAVPAQDILPVELVVRDSTAPNRC
jgi:LacI family transcriptional regulator